MGGSGKVTISTSINYKALQNIIKLAEEYGYSRNRMVEALIYSGIDAMMEPIESTSAYDAGHRHRVDNLARRIL